MTVIYKNWIFKDVKNHTWVKMLFHISVFLRFYQEYWSKNVLIIFLTSLCCKMILGYIEFFCDLAQYRPSECTTCTLTEICLDFWTIKAFKVTLFKYYNCLAFWGNKNNKNLNYCISNATLLPFLVKSEFSKFDLPELAMLTPK